MGAPPSAGARRPGHRLPRRVRDQPRHDDRQRRAARPRRASSAPAPATCSGSSTATTSPSPAWCSPPARSATGSAAGRRCCSGWSASRWPARSARWSAAAGALIAVRFAMGAFAAADLPDHAVDHHQHLPRPAASGPRRSGSGARSPASASRSARSPAACCSPTSAGQSCSSRWCRSPWSRWSRRASWCPSPATRRARARPARPRRCRRPPIGAARLHDHRGARPRLGRDRRPWPGSPSRALLAGRVRRRRAPARAPDDRRLAVPHPAFSRGERRGDRRVLRAVRLHLPGDAVLPVHPRLRHALDRRAHPAGRDSRIALGSVVGAALAPRIGTRAVVDHRPGAARHRRSAGSRCRRRSCRTPQIVGADGADGPRPGPHHRAGHRVHPQRPAAGEGRRRLGRQRRHPGGRRHARRRRARQHLHLAVRRPHRRQRVRRAAGAGPAGRAGLGRRRDRRGRSRPPARPGVALSGGLQASFMSGFHVASFVAAGICWVGALGALALPGRIRAAAPSRRPVEAALS